MDTTEELVKAIETMWKYDCISTDAIEVMRRSSVSKRWRRRRIQRAYTVRPRVLQPVLVLELTANFAPMGARRTRASAVRI